MNKRVSGNWAEVIHRRRERDTRRQGGPDRGLGLVVESLDGVNALGGWRGVPASNRAFNCTSIAAAPSPSPQVLALGGAPGVSGLIPTDVAIREPDLIAPMFATSHYDPLASTTPHPQSQTNHS